MTNGMWQPQSQRSRRRGFTLLELVIVLAVTGILVAVVAPSMTGVTARESLIAEAHVLAAKVSAMREAALEDGLCYAATINGTNKDFVVNKMPDRNCTDTTLSLSGAVITMSGGGGTGTSVPALRHTIPTNQPKLTMTQFGTQLVWLPNGWLRGDNISGGGEGDVSDDTWRVRLTDTRLPASQRDVTVVVNPLGLVCVNPNGGTSCP